MGRDIQYRFYNGNGDEQIEKDVSVLRLDRSHGYRLDYSIGERIRAAYRENTGRTPPVDMPLSYSTALRSPQDRQLLLEIRPDLIKNEKTIQVAILILVVFSLVPLVMGSFLMLLILFGVILVMRSKLKKNTRKMMQVIYQHRNGGGAEVDRKE